MLKFTSHNIAPCTSEKAKQTFARILEGGSKKRDFFENFVNINILFFSSPPTPAE